MHWQHLADFKVRRLVDEKKDRGSSARVSSQSPHWLVANGIICNLQNVSPSVFERREETHSVS